jgi:hypothetical protein
MAPHTTLNQLKILENQLLVSAMDIDEQTRKKVSAEKNLDKCTKHLESLIQIKNPNNEEIYEIKKGSIIISKQIVMVKNQAKILEQKKENISKQINITINKINELKINTLDIEIIKTADNFILNLDKYLKFVL